MHQLAAEWDKKYKASHSPLRNTKRMIAGQVDMLPVNRPCDWCGEVVATGFIHSHCLKEEALIMPERISKMISTT